jgi:hypothetical protein
VQVAFLHTLAANQVLFDGFIQGSELPHLAKVVHHSAPSLQSKVITSPALCIDYLLAQLEQRSGSRVK